MVLDEKRLFAMAGPAVFGRGLDSTRYVRGMRVVGTSATATFQARRVYLVELDWAGDDLDGSCTCPHFAKGNFCKHLVALGLCVIDESGAAGGQPVDDDEPGDVEALIQQLGTDQVRHLLAELARGNASVRREVERRVAAATGDTGRLTEDLLVLAREALSSRGFIDYRRSFEVASDAHAMLDELERSLDVSADAARPALLLTVTELRSLVEHADDSSGVIGDACQRAADLYARACREGHPDPVRLATWLAKFRADSPGWPDVTLADFVDAFDDEALAAYRRAVAALDATHADADHRFEVDRMLLELADHDGDVDRAVALLGQGSSPRYGAIVARLQVAGRDDEAVAVVDRAVEEGRVAAHGRGNDYWLDPMDVAETYRALGRAADALEVLGGVFTSRPSNATFRQLVDFATKVGRGDEMRSWALAVAREQASTTYGDGAVLVQIALADHDLDAAWAAAGEFGPGSQWEALAQASARSRPLDAATLHRSAVDADLEAGADTRRYPGIAKRLARMRDLHEAAGEPGSFEDYLARVRETYGRRPSLMRALDDAGL